MDGSYDLPPFHDDGLIPRNPFLDTFTRRVSMADKKIFASIRPGLIDKVDLCGLRYEATYPGDVRVRNIMDKNPDMGVALSSLVFIAAVLATPRPDGTTIMQGSGVLVGPSTVFTCAHIFEKETLKQVMIFKSENELLHNANGVVGTLVSMPNDIMDLHMPYLNATDLNVEWMRESLDFAVLNLETPIHSEVGYLKVPDRTSIPNQKLSAGEVVCDLGMPADLPRNLTEIFPFTLVKELQVKYPNDPVEILDQLKEKSLFGCNVPIATFGTTQWSCSDTGVYYVRHTGSSFGGISGGPVVNMAYPDELVGLSIGGLIGGSVSSMLRADHPSIVKAYEIYVLNLQ